MSNGGMSQNYAYDLTTPIVCDGYLGFSDWSDSAIRLWAKKDVPSVFLGMLCQMTLEHIPSTMKQAKKFLFMQSEQRIPI